MRISTIATSLIARVALMHVTSRHYANRARIARVAEKSLRTKENYAPTEVRDDNRSNARDA